MRHHSILIVGAIALSGAFATSASAQNARSYVASGGSDSNTCIITSPCATFQKAHDQTNAGGNVYALDPVIDSTPLTVTKGMSFYAPASDPAARPTFLSPSGNAVTVNLPSNSGVTFINFRFDGQGTGANGIQFNTGNSLQIFGGTFGGFQAAAPNGFGIKFTPNSVAKLLVFEPYMGSNGAASTGGAIQVSPTGASGGAQVLLTRVRATFNAFGVAVDTTSSSNGVNVVIDGGEYHFNRQDGIVIVGGSPIGLLARGATSFANGGFGVRAIGANVTARLYEGVIAGNGTGVASVSGGAVVSYGNNAINANAVDGTPTIIPQK